MPNMLFHILANQLPQRPNKQSTEVKAFPSCCLPGLIFRGLPPLHMEAQWQVLKQEMQVNEAFLLS